MFVESKTRTFTKAVVWRLCAVLNSYAILSCYKSDSNFKKAILMNISGFFVFYIFERLFNKIQLGKHKI